MRRLLILIISLIAVALSVNRAYAVEIDLDADPYIPNGWAVVSHEKGGNFLWNPAQMKFYVAKGQKDGKEIDGTDLLKELKGQRPFNANLLDFLFANQRLIPESLKKKTTGYDTYIFFWGTVYRHPDGYSYVRYLSWGDTWTIGWRWGSRWIGLEWNERYPAAVRKK
ncbi:MAG: hypothetical protein Q8R25_04355 [bacterium]|nr:hypothetical protein [bacterium]